MTKRKAKLHKIDPEELVIPIHYRIRDRITFQLRPTRNAPLQTFTGIITCLPEISPLGCYHVETKNDVWFILESEIIGKVKEAA